MGTHRTFLHCFKQMSDSFPSQQQPLQPLPAKETTWKKEKSMSSRWVLCPQNPPANGAWQMIQQISHHPKSLQLPPRASKNHCQKRADFHALNLICGRGSRASTSLMFPGRGALIKHFCPWITDKECLHLASSSLWKIKKNIVKLALEAGRAEGWLLSYLHQCRCWEGKGDPQTASPNPQQNGSTMPGGHHPKWNSLLTDVWGGFFFSLTEL